MSKHIVKVNRNEETIKQYSERVEQINKILNSYDELILEKRKYTEYLRTQQNRGILTKEEYAEIRDKGLNHKPYLNN